MLHKNSSKSKSDLRRRKSTSSVQSVHLEHIDPYTAQRDAQVAATQAYARGKERRDTDLPMFPPLPPSTSKGDGSPRHHARSDSATSPRSENIGQGLRRRQSVRFVAPRPATRSVVHRTSRSAMSSSSQEEGERPASSIYSRDENYARYHGQDILLSTQMPTQETSQPGPKVGMQPTDRVESLLAADDHYVMEDDAAMMGSSYRRLRRSRSMIPSTNTGIPAPNALTEQVTHSSLASDVSRHRPQRLLHSFSSSRLSSLNSTQGGDSVRARPALRAPKSMSFLRNRRAFGGSMNNRNGPEGVDTQYSSQQPSLKSRSSSFFRSKNNRAEPNLRKTLRTSSSNNNLPYTSTTASLPLTKDSSLRGKARKVSSSIKLKLRSMFNKNKSNANDANIPEQQIQAQKTHVSRFIDTQYHGSEADHGAIQDSLSRVTSRAPSPQDLRPDQCLSSRRGSIESLEHDRHETSDEKSRVTSWASSAPNTIASQPGGYADWEKQRLSVIRENGSYAPSQSQREGRPGVSAAPSQECLSQPILPGPTVNSQRVYSALMKRMNETLQLADIVEQQRQSSGETSDPFKTVSTRSSDVGSGDSKEQASPFTIRCIEAGNKEESNISRNAILQDKISNQHADCGFDTLNLGDARPGNMQIASYGTVASYKAHRSLETEDNAGLSPVAQFPRIETTCPSSATLRSRSSAFFGSPECHTFRTTSPYRRALRESMESSGIREATQTRMEHLSGESVRPDSHQLSLTALGTKLRTTYSESVYSQATGDSKPTISSAEHICGDIAEPSSALEDVSVFVDIPTYRPTGRRMGSVASSVDWKTWLSADISKMEATSSPSRLGSGGVSEVEYVLPSMPNAYGHVREPAQTESQEDEEFDTTPPPVQRPTLPTSPLSPIEPNVVKLSPQQRYIVKTTSPPISPRSENEAPPYFEPRSPPPSAPPPPIPMKSPLRSLPSSTLKNIQSARDRKATSQVQTPSTEDSIAARRTKSLARMQTLNRARTTDLGSPHPPISVSSRATPKAQKHGGTGSGRISETVSSSPQLSAAVERQFGPVTKLADAVGRQPEESNIGNSSDNHSSQHTEISEHGADEYAIRSKRMVDLFLQDRRQRVARSEDSAAFI